MPMIADLERQLQQKYSWVKALQPDPEDIDARIEAAEGKVKLRLQVIVSRYHHQDNFVLLDELGQWSAAHAVDLEPVILTEQEAAQLSQLGAVPAVEPYDLFEAYKREEGYPRNAREQLERALEEIHRMLRGLENEFPTSGLHAWNVGLRLEGLYHQLLRWGLALFGRRLTDLSEDWSWLLSQLGSACRELEGLPMEHYPLQLKAFLERHRQLASLAPLSYGDNDLELEQLLVPLESLLRALLRLGRERLTSPEEAERRVTIAWWATMSASILLICVVLILHLINRPTPSRAVALPQGAKTGGITGVYFKGRKFEKFVRKRVDHRLWMTWPGVPAPGVPSDHFSVRWKGFLQAPKSGAYRLCLRFDDGAIMRLGTHFVVDSWQGGPARSSCRSLFLESGWHPLQIKMFEHSGPAMLRLSWQPPGATTLSPVPSKHLCCRE